MPVILDSDDRKAYAAKQLSKVPVDAGMEMEIRTHKTVSNKLRYARGYFLFRDAAADQLPALMDGVEYTKKAMHIYFKEKFLGYRAEETPRGIRESLPSMTELDTEETKILMQKTDAWCAEHGIVIPDNRY